MSFAPTVTRSGCRPLCGRGSSSRAPAATAHGSGSRTQAGVPDLSVTFPCEPPDEDEPADFEMLQVDGELR
jgi:hypothetical protein